MNIAMFTESYKPLLNGVVKSTVEIKEGLEKRGHTVYIFTSGNVVKEKNVFSCPKIEVSQGYGITFPFFRKKEVLKKIDIFHTQQPFVLGGCALYYARKYKKPLIATNHAQYHNYTHYVPILGKSVNAIVYSYVGFFLNKCTKVLLPGGAMKKVLVESYGVEPRKIIVIPNCTTYPKNPKKENIEKIKKKYGLIGKRVLIFTGRIGKEKNLEMLIRIFEEVYRKNKLVKLLLVGGGPEYERIKSYIGKRNLSKVVLMTNYVNYDDVFNYLGASDIFVSTSETEVHPLTLLEAMHVGCVPVTFSAPGFSDTIDNGKNGILVKKKSEKEFASNVLLLLEKKMLLKKFSKNAVKKSLNYEPKKIIPQIEKLYRTAIKISEPPQGKTLWHH
jgi:glycosyltransferase involved in cell wall biosynthesis